MKNQAILLLMILTSAVACNKSQSSTADSTAAGAGIVVSSTALTVALGGTVTITATGGSGQYIGAQASQGTMVQQASGTWLYTAPTTSTSSTITIFVTDTAGLAGQGSLILSGVTTTPTTGNAFTSTSCGGTFTITDGRSTGTLVVVQNASNQISGYLRFQSLGWTYPISGSCSVPVGQTTGSINFQNMALQDVYAGSISLSGGAMVFTGTATFTDGRTNTTFTANVSAPAAAPVAETMACGGSYNATIATNAGQQIFLVHNGTGTVAGYLINGGYIYSLSGTCGASINLTNNTNGSVYTGSATFTGTSVSMGGTFLTRATQYSPAATFNWSATK